MLFFVWSIYKATNILIIKVHCCCWQFLQRSESAIHFNTLIMMIKKPFINKADMVLIFGTSWFQYILALVTKSHLLARSCLIHTTLVLNFCGFKDHFSVVSFSMISFDFCFSGKLQLTSWTHWGLLNFCDVSRNMTKLNI